MSHRRARRIPTTDATARESTHVSTGLAPAAAVVVLDGDPGVGQTVCLVPADTGYRAVVAEPVGLPELLEPVAGAVAGT